MATYKKTIASLINASPFGIDADIQINRQPPTAAHSAFLTNKEQGDWAEQVVRSAINTHSTEYRAVHYGHSDDIAAGEPGFANFYAQYQNELNSTGKKPDLLIFRRSDTPRSGRLDCDDDNLVRKAIAAIEVRSSSFLANAYATFMNNRTQTAEAECTRIQKILLQEPWSSLLEEKRPAIHKWIQHATPDTFRELKFRSVSWSSSEQLIKLSEHLKNLNTQIKLLHKRDYLSITPKLEDLALVNRWIQHFGVKHYYLQVFFDKAYVISFKDILTLSSKPEKEGIDFSIEKDTKNQGKTTIKINIQMGKEIIGRIEMPKHHSKLKSLDRGRLLFYVTFKGGRGYLDPAIFLREIVNGD